MVSFPPSGAGPYLDLQKSDSMSFFVVVYTLHMATQFDPNVTDVLDCPRINVFA